MFQSLIISQKKILDETIKASTTFREPYAWFPNSLKGAPLENVYPVLLKYLVFFVITPDSKPAAATIVLNVEPGGS